ncbi:hypothetical protein QVD17_02655 [Tagetes erecta]|uniref:Uncharacterized protein n=1 Tax=Tagetes erecta TaxID=13708 RepID=A0AAD8LD67_TARER|nr:hypothetical protein QVD17_02655 [Tagetes erecta]
MKNLRCLIVKTRRRVDLILSTIKMQKLAGSTVKKYDIDWCIFLSNELQYFNWDKYPARTPFPDTFQPNKLVVLKLSSKQTILWEGCCKYLPALKVLQLFDMQQLLHTPNFDGLPRLQELTLDCCNKLDKIHPSFENHTSLESLNILGCWKLKLPVKISQMKNLKTLELKACNLREGEIPYGIGELFNLQELHLNRNCFSRLDFSLSQLTQLKLLNVSYCYSLLELPELPSSLAVLKADYCKLQLSDNHWRLSWKL